MPTSPALAEDLAAQVRDLYEAAEYDLLGLLARALAADLQSPRWAELKLRAVGDLLEAVDKVAAALQQDTTGEVHRALTTAYDRGRQAAVAELGALDIGRELAARDVLPNAAAVDRLAMSLAADTRPLYSRITRSVADVYRRVTSRASAGTLLGATTRRQAAQSALDQFAARGISGFVDRSGRGWDMASYAEMAVRSVTARAAIDGHTDVLSGVGIGLVIISDVPMECPKCTPWEGKVLSIQGPSGARVQQEQHAERGRLLNRWRTVPVDVAGSLIEARAAGLFHCNCRHSASAYLPGVSTPPEPAPSPNGATYKDTQQQRYLERQVRAWKRRQAVALDDQARARAGASIRAYQARLREHTARTGLPRKPVREQIGAAR